MKAIWLFLFGALCGIAGTGWYLHRAALPDAFAALAGPPTAATQLVGAGALAQAPPLAAHEPASPAEIVEPNCEPLPPWSVGAGTAPSAAAAGDEPAPLQTPTATDGAPATDAAAATETVAPPAAEAADKTSVEIATTAQPAAPATAPETPAEKAVTADPVAIEPVPPTEPAVEKAAVPTPIAESFQAHPDALIVPVTGVMPDQLSDTFDDLRGAERRHEALDIMAPKGTPVVAVDDGKVVKLFNSVRGGLTVYQFDPSEKLAYYYAHLDSYAPGVTEGKQLKRGDLIGHVGVTGNSNPDAPHLHFAVFELDPEKRWWKGTAINPYPLFKR